MATKTNRGTVVAAFHSQSEAQRAVRDLKNAGFSDDQIGVAAQHGEGSADTEGTLSTEGEGNQSGTGAVAGATTGLGVGALWGIGVVAGVLPAIGPVIAGGALAAIAASAAGTAVAGGLVGALIGLGVPEEEAEFYEGEVRQGRTLVTVKATGSDADKARSILDGYDSYDYHRRETEYARNPNAKERLDAEGRIVARKEVLDVHKHAHDAGEARVRKEVHSETAHVDVPVQREELVVERTPLHGREGGKIEPGTKEEERIVLREEEVDVDKRTVEKEAAKVGKRTVTDKKRVDADLKEEDIVVENEREQARRNRERAR